MSEFRICGNDYVYCDGECDKCPRIIPTYATSSTDTVYRVERKDEYVVLRPGDIHFIDEDAEAAFYESLTERKEE